MCIPFKGAIFPQGVLNVWREERVDSRLSWLDPLLLPPVPEVGGVEDLDSHLVLRKLSRLRPHNAGHRLVTVVETHEMESFAVFVGTCAAEHGAVPAQILSNGVFDPRNAMRVADQADGKQASDAFATTKLIEELRGIKQDVKQFRAILIIQLSGLERFGSDLPQALGKKTAEGFQRGTLKVSLFDVLGSLVEPEVTDSNEMLAAEVFILERNFRGVRAAWKAAARNKNFRHGIHC
jgi:hypothetical protein